jgi:glutamate-1-semialdehyde 2,1-aminomutase
MNCIPPRAGYLQGLRDLCSRHGTVLIFDEVMTGFRVALGGAQQLYGITPDLSTFGKIIGGGMPVGAYGGKREIMEKGRTVRADLPGRHAFRQSGGDGRGPGHAGTDPGARVSTPSSNARHTCWRTACVRSRPMPACHSTRTPSAACSACSSRRTKWKPIHRPLPATCRPSTASSTRCSSAGVYLAPSAFEAGFMSLAHSAQDIADTLQAARDAFRGQKQPS